MRRLEKVTCVAIWILVTAGVVATLAKAWANPAASERRIAYSCDGNYHDPDDVSATAMTLALIWRADANLVHLEWANHLGLTDQDMHAQMMVSVLGNLAAFGIDPAIVHDVQGQHGTVIAAKFLADQIDASTPGDLLYVIEAGPWEQMARAFDVADPARHEHVRIVTHHPWNDGHDDDHGTGNDYRNRAEFMAQYQNGGKWSGVTPPTVLDIGDQNQHAFNSPIGDWWWMRKSPETRFVLWRMLVGGGWGDASDAGMMFFALTLNESPTMGDVRSFFNL